MFSIYLIIKFKQAIIFKFSSSVFGVKFKLLKIFIKNKTQHYY